MRWPSNLRFWTPPDLEESTAPPRTSPRPVRAVSAMRLRRGNRGASSRMTSSVYRPLCSFGFAFRGGRFSVPCEVIRSGGDYSCCALRIGLRPTALRFALRHGLRPSTRTSYFASGCALRIGLRVDSRFATGSALTALRRRTACVTRNQRRVKRNSSPRGLQPRAFRNDQRQTQHHERVAQAPRSGGTGHRTPDVRSFAHQ